MTSYKPITLRLGWRFTQTRTFASTSCCQNGRRLVTLFTV